MATFKDHIEGLTGLTVSTAPTTGELTQFLIDGVKDVVNKIIKLRPQELPKFCKTTNSMTTVPIVGKVLSITREHDSTSVLRSCSKISPNVRYLATDVDSLHYRSKYNPAYYELDGLIYCIPEAGSGNNDLVVTQVHYDVGLAHGDTYNNSDSAIDNFPIEYEYLVALYAGAKSIQNALSAVDISTFSSTAVSPVPPSSPSISSPGVSAITIDTLPTAPTYVSPVMAPDFSDANTWINTEEDSEMAASRVQVIGAQLSEFQTRTQDSLNNFNKENVEYQAGIQKNLQQAQINMQDAQKEADLTLQSSIQDYTLEVQKYSADLQKYQADIGKDVQTYQQEIAEKGAEYQWQVARLQDLKQEYNQAFALMAPQQAQASPSRGARR